MATVARALPGPSISTYSPSASIYETGSESSSSTVPGPGALTGKAIKALGQVTIRGIDHFVILRQLSVISNHFPLPDEKAERVEDVEALYDDVLEFSRQGLYREEINRKVFRLLLGQIGMGETRFLVRALCRWDGLELRLFLSEILIQLAPLWNPCLGMVLSSPLLSAYSSPQTSAVSMLPLLSFMGKLIRGRSFACRAVVDVGFLDVLMLIRAFNNLDRLDIIFQIESIKDHRRRRLLVVINAILLDIVGYPEHRSIVLNHPICSTWVAPRLTSLEIVPLTCRETALFLTSEQDIPNDESPLYLSLDLPVACKLGCISTVDGKELVNSLTFDVLYDQALRVFLLRSSYKQKVALLSRVIRYMLEPGSAPPVPADPSAHPDALRSRYRLLFFLRLIRAIAWSPSNRAALLDAGVIDFLIHIVQTDIPDSYLAIIASQAHEEHIPAIIREHGLAQLLGGPLAKASRLVRLISGAFSALFPGDVELEPVSK